MNITIDEIKKRLTAIKKTNKKQIKSKYQKKQEKSSDYSSCFFTTNIEVVYWPDIQRPYNSQKFSKSKWKIISRSQIERVASRNQKGYSI